MSNKIIKYRPVLTAIQIEKICQLARLESPLSKEAISILSSLSPFLAKIENLAITPAYEMDTVRKGSLLASLSDDMPSPASIRDKAAFLESSYNTYILQPDKCSLAVIKAAKEYMYINELLSPKEVAAFEAEMLGS